MTTEEEKEYTPKIPKFDGSNDGWDIWQTQFVALMQEKGYARLLDANAQTVPKDDESLEDLTSVMPQSWRPRRRRGHFEHSTRELLVC